MLLRLKVQPRSRDTSELALRGDAVVVRLSSPPVDGKANAELVELIARLFSRPKSAVSVERGHRSRDKLVRIRGASGVASEKTGGKAGGVPPELPKELSALGLRLENSTCPQ